MKVLFILTIIYHTGLSVPVPTVSMVALDSMDECVRARDRQMMYSYETVKDVKVIELVNSHNNTKTLVIPDGTIVRGECISTGE